MSTEMTSMPPGWVRTRYSGITIAARGMTISLQRYASKR